MAESFERIHRSNLVGMGVAPFVFEGDTSWKSLGLQGDETITILGLAEDLKPRKRMEMEITSPTARTQRSRSSAASIRSTSWNISATAESCNTC